uniref:Uncharacterized protein n=1 Tax=Lotharella vacuolata TaxID=74820 RepID=A0A0H5BK53_9EUKA|nr:hypothetical protein [Lotharella vacuolata]
MKNIFIINKFTNKNIRLKKKILHKDHSNFKSFKVLKRNLNYLNSDQDSYNNSLFYRKKQTYLNLDNNTKTKIKPSILVLPINFYYRNQNIYAVEIGTLYELGFLYNLGYFKSCFCYSKLNLINYHNQNIGNRLKCTISKIIDPRFYRFSININCTNKLWSKIFYTNTYPLKLSNFFHNPTSRPINYTGRNYLIQNYWVAKETLNSFELAKVVIDAMSE